MPTIITTDPANERVKKPDQPVPSIFKVLDGSAREITCQFNIREIAGRGKIMASPFESEDSFFIKAAHRLSNPNCFSLIVREELIKSAVRKNGSSRDEMDENLLFPPSIIRKVLVREKVAKMFGCKCTMCHSVKGREILTDNQLIDVVTAEEGAVQRKEFDSFSCFRTFGFGPDL